MYESRVDPPVPADIGATDFTLEFWMRAAAGNSQPAVPCDQSGYHWINGNIVFDRDRLPPNVRDFGLSIADGRIVFGVESSNGSYTICGSSNVVNPQTWRHVAVQRRVADGMLFVYVDGVLERSAQGPTGDISYPNNAQPQDAREALLVIGREKYEFGPPGFRGWIDEVRLSNVLRYASKFPVPPAPFVLDADTLALYHFDEGTGDTIVDQNANQSPAQRLYSVAAGPEWSTETPFGASGRFAAATYGVGEGAGTRTVTVERGGGSAGSASVQILVTGGTATANEDFQLAPHTLTWADGDGGPKTFSITVLDDALDESDETIVLTLSNASGCESRRADVVDGDDHRRRFPDADARCAAVNVVRSCGGSCWKRRTDGRACPRQRRCRLGQLRHGPGYGHGGRGLHAKERHVDVGERRRLPAGRSPCRSSTTRRSRPRRRSRSR